jgi:hypothetical protein
MQPDIQVLMVSRILDLSYFSGFLNFKLYELGLFGFLPASSGDGV